MQETISIEINDELKEQFEEVLESMGLDLETAINIFAHEVVRLGKLPFDLVPDEEISAATEK